MAQWFSGDVVANGLRLHYYRTGGDKPPLVIAHGITDNGLAWTRAARALEQDYDVILYDRRGHGVSEAPQEGYTFYDHAADLAGLIAALNLDRPRVIGHSGGAAAAAICAADHPDRLTRLILEDPPWGSGWGGWEPMTAGLRQWFLDLVTKTRSVPGLEPIRLGAREGSSKNFYSLTYHSCTLYHTLHGPGFTPPTRSSMASSFRGTSSQT